MGWNLFEIASFLGRPVCLYEFTWGENVYRYTSADRNIQYPYIDGDPENGDWWQAISISDNGFTQGMTAQDFVVTLPRSTALAQLFVGTPPSDVIELVCWRFHKDDPDEEATVYWSGSVANIRGIDAVKAEAIGIPLTNTLRRTGLRLCWERGCTHSVYDEGCRADKELFKTVTEITFLTGDGITVADLGAFAGQLYAGGYIEWVATVEGTKDRRAIESYIGGNAFILLGMTDRLEVGQEITMYLGCDLTAATCENVFNNLANHGGFEFLAGKSPFDGDPVF